jgi:signal transduction histidine kinase
MFQQTLRKLTILNSVVFLILFVIFGGIVLGYTSYGLFDRVDEAMKQRVAAFKIAGGRVTFQPRRFVYDPRTIVLLRNTEGRIVSPFSLQGQDFSDVIEVAAGVHTGEPRTIKHEDHTYRALNMPYLSEDNELIVNQESVKVRELVAVSIVDSEVALLDNLFKIFIAGVIIGTTMILLAGYYLARRALIPIRLSWEKQQQFAADASHELRSPLTVIQSNAELILRHPAHTVEEESKRVTNILREAMRMKRLVSTLLTLARADADQTEMHFSPVLLNEMIEAISEQFKVLAEIKGIEFTTEVAETLELIADKERLHQLLIILLDNAVKFTSSPGQVILTCYEQSNIIHIKVRDTGSGIPQSDLPHIFDRFFRGDKSRSRDTGGTGLGLAIAQWIVDKHYGKIKVDSTVGVGTEFHILLPVKNQ